MVDNASVGQMLAQKDVSNLAEIAQLAVADAQVLRTILDGLVAKDDTYRYNCFRVLHQVSQNEPRTLYPEWDYFIQLLGSQNAYHRAISVQILANLTRIDAEQRFDALFDRYFALLDDDKVMVARYLAQNAWKIAGAKPYLREQIIARLLDVEEMHHPPSRKALIKADIIQSFEAMFAESQNRERMRAFVGAQLDSESPKARQAARAFLERHGK